MVESVAPNPSIWRTGQCTVVEMPKEIDASNVDGIRELLLALLNAGGSGDGPLITDLTGTTFCDSSGVNALLRARTRAIALRRGLYAAVRPGGTVRRVFDAAGVSRVIPTYDDVSSAIARAGAAPDRAGGTVRPGNGQSP